MLLHRREVAIFMQESVPMHDAVRADDDVGGLAHGDAPISQPAVIAGGARGKVGIEKRDEVILTQIALDARGVGVVPGTLEYFKQDEVADEQRLPAGRGLELGGRGRPTAAQDRDPDGAVDENQAARDVGLGASRRGRLPNPIP